MYIYDEDMNLITKQDTDVDCLELAGFTVSKAGTYKVEIIEKSTGRDFDQVVSASYFIK